MRNWNKALCYLLKVTVLAKCQDGLQISNHRYQKWPQRKSLCPEVWQRNSKVEAAPKQLGLFLVHLGTRSALLRGLSSVKSSHPQALRVPSDPAPSTTQVQVSRIQNVTEIWGRGQLCVCFLPTLHLGLWNVTSLSGSVILYLNHPMIFYLVFSL